MQMCFKARESTMIKLLKSFAVVTLLSACGSGESIQIVESCNVDSPANNAELSSKQDFKIAGWAYDKKTATAPDKISLELYGNENKIIIATRVSRPDIVKAFNSSAIEMSGYDAIVPAYSISPGQYELVIVQETPEHKIKCVKGHAININ